MLRVRNEESWLTREAAAARAGVTGERLDQLAAAGLIASRDPMGTKRLYSAADAAKLAAWRAGPARNDMGPRTTPRGDRRPAALRVARPDDDVAFSRLAGREWRVRLGERVRGLTQRSPDGGRGTDPSSEAA